MLQGHTDLVAYRLSIVSIKLTKRKDDCLIFRCGQGVLLPLFVGAFFGLWYCKNGRVLIRESSVHYIWSGAMLSCLVFRSRSQYGSSGE